MRRRAPQAAPVLALWAQGPACAGCRCCTETHNSRPVVHACAGGEPARRGSPAGGLPGSVLGRDSRGLRHRQRQARGDNESQGVVGRACVSHHCSAPPAGRGCALFWRAGWLHPPVRPNLQPFSSLCIVPACCHAGCGDSRPCLLDGPPNSQTLKGLQGPHILGLERLCRGNLLHPEHHPN